MTREEAEESQDEGRGAEQRGENGGRPHVALVLVFVMRKGGREGGRRCFTTRRYIYIYVLPSNRCIAKQTDKQSTRNTKPGRLYLQVPPPLGIPPFTSPSHGHKLAHPPVSTIHCDHPLTYHSRTTAPSVDVYAAGQTSWHDAMLGGQRHWGKGAQEQGGGGASLKQGRRDDEWWVAEGW